MATQTGMPVRRQRLGQIKPPVVEIEDPRPMDAVDLLAVGLDPGNPGQVIGLPVGAIEETRESLASVLQGDRRDGQAVRGMTAAERDAITDGIVTHRTSPRRIVFDRDGFPVPCAAEHLPQALASGLFPVCPLCGQAHYDPEMPHDPNLCSARPRVKYVDCPVCKAGGRTRRIWDDLSKIAGQAATRNEDPNAITPGLLNLGIESTPEDRLRARLKDHLIAKHPAEARAMGIAVPTT